MRSAVSFLACFGAAACSLQRAEVAQNAQTQMVGLSKEHVLQCMGPSLQKSAGGKRRSGPTVRGTGARPFLTAMVQPLLFIAFAKSVLCLSAGALAR